MAVSVIGAVLLIAVLALGWWWYQSRRPDIRFAADHPDFARLEHEFPLSVAEREALTPERLAEFSQEQVDQIYGRLTAGPDPRRRRTTATSSSRAAPTARRGSERSSAARSSPASPTSACGRPKALGRHALEGQGLLPDERLLRNRIEDLAVLAPFTGGNAEGIQKITVNGRDECLLFPAKLYCGQSLLDGRRESVIIDYVFTDELPGYRENPTRSAAATAFGSATRSAWCGPASTSAART